MLSVIESPSTAVANVVKTARAKLRCGRKNPGGGIIIGGGNTGPGGYIPVGGIIGPPASSPIYVLRPDYAAAAAGPAVRWQLTVELPQAPDALDTMRILLLDRTGRIWLAALST